MQHATSICVAHNTLHTKHGSGALSEEISIVVNGLKRAMGGVHDGACLHRAKPQFLQLFAHVEVSSRKHLLRRAQASKHLQLRQVPTYILRQIQEIRSTTSLTKCSALQLQLPTMSIIDRTAVQPYILQSERCLRYSSEDADIPFRGAQFQIPSAAT